jgi:hypothetical protein
MAATYRRWHQSFGVGAAALSAIAGAVAVHVHWVSTELLLT